jgi:hypothetical protein
MVYLHTKNPYLGKFWRAMDWKMFVYFLAIRNSLIYFGTFYGTWVYFAFA